MKKLGSDGKEQRAANFYKAAYVTLTQFAALTPLDGDEVYLVADATNGVIWHLRYNAGGSTYKWEMLGGAPLYAEIQTSELGVGGSVYADIATAGPSITAPRAGQFEIEWSSLNNSLGTSGDSRTAPKLGSASTADTDKANYNAPNSGQFAGGTIGRKIIRTLAASDLVKVQYNSGGQAHGISLRDLYLRPIRIS